ncbi:MAG: C10 family peptidase [Bacteroidales bacterium]|nr:C10 family peptidase [Bacteroidales bacterium]
MMKKGICFLSLVALFAASSLWARPVDRTTAQRVGSAFLASVGHTASAQLTSVETPFEEFYVFNAEGGGFVMVAGDDCVRPILAYSLDRLFQVGQMPANLRSWLEGYNDEIARQKRLALERKTTVEAHPVVDIVADEWRRLTSGDALEASLPTSVAPLMATTWDQSPRYNALCPYDTLNGDYSVAGCVATATAQIMKYWNHPATGYGSHSYQSNFGPLSADFGATTYAWNNMPTALTAASSQTEINAVAELLYHIGVAVEMDYSATGSGAQTYSWNGAPMASSQFAWMQYFKYAPDIAVIPRSGSDDNTFSALMRGEIDQSRPISFTGRSATGGHNFVLDGYDNYNNFHINWGWGGYCDGYYTIGALNPAPGGTGGNSTSSYNDGNVAMIGIRPNPDFGTGGTVTVTTAGGNASCTATGGGSYDFGETVTLSAAAGEGYRFAEWSNHSRINPFNFIMNGGSYNLTARIESIGTDTMSYCGNLGRFTSWGESTEGFDKYWGIRLPASSLTAGRSLSALEFFAIAMGNYDVTVYSGTSSPTDVVYTTSIYVSDVDLNGWFSVYLPQPYVVESGKSLWLTLHNSDVLFPAAISSSCGNPDGFLYGPEFNPDPSWNQYTFLIRGRFDTPGILADGDTLSYCGDKPHLTTYVFNEWGILIPAADLQGRNYLQAVKFYANREAVYNIHIYKGGSDAPGTPIHTQPAYATGSGWCEVPLDSTIAIGAADSLWITLSSDDNPYPAAACRYTGSPNSNWLSSDGSFWSQLGPYHSWLIKAVTSASTPVLPLPTVIIRGDLYVAAGSPATFTAAHSAGTTVSWNWYFDSAHNATGDTVTITASHSGSYCLYASVTNGQGTAVDSIWVNVVDCGQPITEYPYTLGFEARNNMACVETLDADGDGHTWHLTDQDYYAGYRSFVSDLLLWGDNGYDTLASDNWFFLPVMSTRAAGGYTLTWQSLAQYSDNIYAHYGVYIDTTAGTDTAHYVLLEDFVQQDYYWQEHSVDLSAYAGKTFRLAFRHYNNNGGLSSLILDNIVVNEEIPFFREGDTISYCGYHPIRSTLGYNGGTTYWAIRFLPERLEGCDSVKSVLFFAPSAGTYSIELSQNQDPSMSTFYSDEATFTSTSGWQTFTLPTPIAIDNTHPLWVVMSSPEAYPAAYTYFSGDNNSDWISGNGVNWVHSSQYGFSTSWMIKVVTAAYDPCGDASLLTADTAVVACDSYTWGRTGETYTQDTLLNVQLAIPSAQGCDSSVTLHLTVNRSSESDVTLEIAAADLPYSYEGQTFADFGQYEVVIANAVGCDSTIHLTLTHNSGIDDIQNSKFEIQNLIIYPNPTTGLVKIEVNNNAQPSIGSTRSSTSVLNSQFQVEVLDLAGRRVARFENTNTLDLTNLPKGTYTLQITTPQQTTLKKIVKE